MLSLCSGLSIAPSFAQAVEPDTAFLRSAVKNAVALYRQSIGKQAHLYNGLEYVDHRKHYFEGHQFLDSNEFSQGAVFYEGGWYEQVPMLYDLVTDEIVIKHEDSGLKQRLISEKVDTFSLYGHTFVRLGKDKSSSTSLPPGFYDLIHSNKTKVLVKRTKSPQQKATSTGMEGWFDAGEKYYVWKEGTYTQVSRKGSVLKVFEDRKKALQKHLRAQKIKYRKNREEAIRELASFYDGLEAQTSAE